jgi:hypothetical protein
MLSCPAGLEDESASLTRSARLGFDIFGIAVATDTGLTTGFNAVTDSVIAIGLSSTIAAGAKRTTSGGAAAPTALTRVSLACELGNF